MPPIAAAPAFYAALASGAAVTGGAIISSRASGRASDASERAGSEALAFEREREETRRMEHEQREAQLRAQWEAEQARRAPYRQAAASILARYGFRAPTAPTSMPKGWAPGMEGQQPASNMPVNGKLPGHTLRTDPIQPMASPRALTLGNLDKWNEWGTYGGRS